MDLSEAGSLAASPTNLTQVCSTDTPVVPVVPTHHQSLSIIPFVHVRITYLGFPTFLYRMRQEAGQGLGLRLQVSQEQLQGETNNTVVSVSCLWYWCPVLR